MKVFVLYNENSPNVSNLARQLASALQAQGADVLYKADGNAKKSADESQYMILMAEKTEDINSFEPEWRYFQNELRWKRKAEGEIIILAGENVDAKRIPFAVRSSKTYSLTDTDFLKDRLCDEKPQPTPPPAAPINKKPRIENGCKQDHVFESIHSKNRFDLKKQKTEQSSNAFAQKSKPEKTDPSDRDYEGISRPAPTSYDDSKNRQNEEYEYHIKNPFSDYKHEPKTPPKKSNDIKIGCGVISFLILFSIFIVLTLVMNS